MSAHESKAPTREDVLEGSERPVPRGLKIASIIFAVVGTLVFVIGAIIGNDRVWHALLFNWLYFSTISSAGVMFVAVQRITTAR